MKLSAKPRIPANVNGQLMHIYLNWLSFCFGYCQSLVPSSHHL